MHWQQEAERQKNGRGKRIGGGGKTWRALEAKVASVDAVRREVIH
jgi:hypothetical protein